LKIGIKEIIKTKKRIIKMTDGNPTLIAGFNDVMVHIRNQEKRIQELEKELQEEKELSKMVLESKIRELTPEHNELKEIYADRDRVKEENEKLKQEIRDVRKQIENTEKLNKKLNEENIQCRKEVEAVSSAVENECEASGIMEVMNMRIEDAEKQVEEYKLKYEEQSEKMVETTKRANGQIQRLITQGSLIKNLIQTLITNDKNGKLWNDGIQLYTEWYIYGTGDTYHDILEQEIDEMNHEDWNEDNNHTKIIYEAGAVCSGSIRLDINDSSSEEETDEDA